MYKFKLNENTEQESMSINGFVVTKKEWSKEHSSKPSQLEGKLRTRQNMKGIVDYQYIAPDKQKSIIFDSERDCIKEVMLYHRNEFVTMSPTKLLQLGEIYNIKYAARMNKDVLIGKLLAMQEEFENTIPAEEVEKYYSPMRAYILKEAIAGNDIPVMPTKLQQVVETKKPKSTDPLADVR